MNRLLVLSGLLGVSSLVAATTGPTVGNLQLVSEVRLDRTIYLYTYRATLTNPGAALNNATATVASTAASTVVVDNLLTFGNVPANSSRVSTDTFSFRQDRTVSFDIGVLQFTISSSPGNQAPTANAGPDQSVATAATVALNGAGSSDPDGNPLTYSWVLVQRPATSLATLSNAATVNPTFVADRYGTYRVQLTVNDGTVSSTPDEVVVNTTNSAPIANAGPDQSVTTGATVQLNGSGSSDIDGQPLTYSWSFISRPAGSAAVLLNPTTVNPTFVADKFGSYSVQLVVNDGLVNSAPDLAVVNTLNSPPTANAGPDQTAPTGATVLLNGSGSSDIDGQALTYAWSFISRPAGSAAILLNPTTVNPTFVADKFGSYSVQLVVNDGTVGSAPDLVVISTLNSAPSANAGPDQTVTTGATVLLNGSASSDIDGQALSYTWSLISRPSGSTAALLNPGTVNPTFVADRFGSYTIQLIVNDGFLDSAPDTVVISNLNSAPTANAGPDQATQVGLTVTLDGTGSTDVDGQPLLYSWSFVSRPAGSAASLNDPSAVKPTFVADAPGTYVVQLIVNDGTVGSAPDTVSVTTTNVAPTANAGPDQTAYVGNLVTLNGSASSDPDGQPLTFSWSLPTRPAGSAAVLSSLTAVSPTFTIDRPGTYVAQLVVNDGMVNSAPDTVQITTLSTAPAANAGPDQTVSYLATVQLNGSASGDVDGDPLTYAWSITSRPAGSTAALSSATIVNPVFPADRPGTFVVQLMVNDGTANSAPDTVVITTTNSAPTADAGPDQSATVGQLVSLNGAGSSDSDGNPLTYAWSFTSRPAGSLAILSNPTSATPGFTVDIGGTYVVQLIVSDGILGSAPDTVTISTGNLPPVANAGPDQAGVLVGSTVHLDGSGSNDPDHNPLTYSWSLTTRPAGSTATLSNPTSVDPTFVPDRRGTYVAQLIVNDGTVNSPSDNVQITTANRAPVANAGADQSGIDVGATVNLDGSASSDPDGDTITYAWAFSVKPAGSGAILTGGDTATPSFVPDRGGLYRLQLTVNDGLESSVPDTVDVTVNNRAPAANAGPDQADLSIGATVHLNGSASSDPDGDSLTYAWTFSSQPAGSTAAIANPTSATPTFVPDVPGTYVVQLVVNDGTVNSAPDTVQIAVVGGVITLSLMDTSLIAVSGTATVLITLSQPAPTGGLSVNVTSDAPAVISVGAPNPVPIPQGSSAGTVVLNGVSLGATTIHGAAADFATGNLVVSTTSNIINLPTTQNVPLGQTTSIPININPAAAGSGLTITVTSSDPSKVQVQTPAVTIAAGQVVGSITVLGVAPGSATVLATASGYASDTTVATTTGALNITEASRTMTPGFPQSITVQLESGGAPVAAPAPGIGFTVTAADPACVANGAGTITTGLVNATFPLAYGGTASLPCTTQITASGASLTSDTINVTVNPNPAITVSHNGTANSIGASLQVSGSGSLAISNHGGRTVRVESSAPALFTVSTSPTIAGGAFVDIAIADGVTSFAFYLHGQDNVVGSGTVTASATGFTDGTATVNVVQSTARIRFLAASMSSEDADDAFTVETGVPAAGNTGFAQLQNVRAGATLTATVSNSNATAGRLTTLLGSDQTRTVTIGAGDSSSPSAVATGGVAFDPLAGGTTVVSVAIPNFVATPASSVTVSVTGGTIAMNLPATVGAGLMLSSRQAVLSGSSHGGVTMRIESGDPSKVLVSPNSTTAGTAFFEQYVPNGTTTVTYYLHGVEGASGAATITASAATFSDGTGTATVVPFAAEITGLTAAKDFFDANDPFQVRTGLPNAGRTALSNAYQEVRAGSPGIVFTVSGSVASVGQLVTSGGAAQTRTVTVAAGTYVSPASVATGGIEFDALGVGSTVVGIASPGMDAVTTSSVTVTVSPASMTLGGFPLTVGAGLMQEGRSVTLGGTQHGGTDVTVTSAVPSKVLLSLDTATAGTAAITKHLDNGQDTFSFVVHAVESQAGAVTVTAAATNFTSVDATVTVVAPAVDILGLAASTTSLSADDPFYVRTGVPNTGHTALSVGQPVRAGQSVTVTVTNSNAAVAQLTTLAGTAQSRTVTVNGGSNNSPTSVAAGGIAFDPIGGGTTTVDASAPGFVTIASASQDVAVSSPGITLAGLPQSVGSGLMTQSVYCCSATLGGSLHGGVTVRVESSNSAVVLVSPNVSTAGAAFFEQFVADGSTLVPFIVHGVEGITGAVTITVSAPGFTNGSSTATNVRPMVDIAGLTIAPNIFTANDAFNVRTGIGSSGNMTELQLVRAGAASVVFTIANSNAAVGQLHQSGGDAQTATVTVAAGQYSSPTTASAGGVEFDPLGAGTTVVAASNAAFTTAADGAPTVTVSPGALTFPGLPASVGQGLMDTDCCSVGLSGANHGGVTIRVTSSDPLRVLVSPNATTVGATWFDKVVANGTSSFTFVIHGVEGATGPATITATNASFTTGSGIATVVVPALDISGLSATYSASAANDIFTARVGVANAGNTALSQLQAVRFGSPGVAVTVTNTNAAVAQLETTSGGGAQSQVVAIAAGQTSSPNTMPTGAVAFDPLAAGITFVQVTAAGFVQTNPNGNRQVTVN